ncbi:hypothetical protein H9Q69_006906 [Fusarium xylarioides]|uniref:Uncharacterized protein n=1 Tax=Fusarium xylarioides TaxID=221167 RepID=A0A9P7LHL3_9HYPO|nr:hypothetical protein H9Q70_007522 [Fusarium xylarioides]KAG5767794.1 hypothetical protein H9Q72_004491 [Fusarium xylarioides]KAG5778342.1 hypothetical protein H9Q73_008000 [Fusarium xylarioides]KAG5794030.1 hypothetical protein H9Q69_006906 [Fusarium xylarioides]KAG5814661.1 hypothetical protein H9Q71_003154 [Fusarium xylarioides]
MSTHSSSRKNSPRKFVSESSDTRSLTSSKFAQLLSKFEVLEAVSSVGSPPLPSSKTKPTSAIKVTSTIEQTSLSASKPSSHVSTGRRERGSTGSSHVSSGRFVPSSQEPPRTRRVKTFGAQSPVISTRNADSKARQKSVAERRIMFEAADQQAQASSPTRTSIPHSPSKLAHSKSWQSIKTRRSAAEPREDDIPTTPIPVHVEKAFSPTSHTIPSPRTLLASDDPFGTWRSPLNRPDDSWTSFKRNSLAMSAPDASPSYIKSQYTEVTPSSVQAVSTSRFKLDDVRDDVFVEKNNVAIEETRQNGWVRNARKIASSLSNTVSAGSSTLRRKSRGSHDAPSQPPSNNSGVMSFRLARASTPSRSSLPRSRISNLRKQFDQLKDQPVASVAPLETKRRESIITKTSASSSPSKHPLLGYSDSSESEMLNAPKFRSKSYAPRGSRATVESPQTPVGRRNTEKHISPLKQKIDLFESLDRQVPSFDSPRPIETSKQSMFKINKRKSSVVGPLRSFKGTLRRISTSYRRIPSEWSTTSSRDIAPSQLRSSDEDTVVQDGQAAEFANDEPLSPHSVDAIPGQPVLGQTFLTNEVISPLSLEKPSSLPRSSITQAGFNMDGEAGLGVAPPPLFAEPQRRFSHTKYALSRAANRFSLPDIEKELELIELLENDRQTVPTHNTLVSKVVCELEQPRPVRTNELKRLVSLCKEKARKLSAGRSE